MRKVFVLALVLGLALSAGGMAVATSTDGGPLDTAPMVGVQYEQAGEMGQLSIIAEPGERFIVRDATGVEVAGGEMDATFVSLPVSNVGIGPGGSLLSVELGSGDILFVTDPNWEWN